MRKENKIFLVILIYGIMWSTLLLGVNAEFSKDIIVDGELEEDYDELKTTAEFTYYYANDEDYHYIFVKSPVNLSEIDVLLSSDSFDFTISEKHTSTSLLSSHKEDFTLEISLLIELTQSINISMVDNIDITLDLTPEQETQSKLEFTFLEWLNYQSSTLTVVDGIFIGGFGVFIFMSLVFVSWRLKIYPIIVVMDEGYNSDKLGRFVKEERSKEVKGYWKLYFKSGWKTIRIVYCNENFAELREKVWRRVNVIQDEIPNYVLGKLKLAIPLKERIRKRDFKNNLKFGLLKVACRLIPNNTLAISLYESIETVETKNLIKKVPFLQFNKSMKRITTVYSLEYKQRIPHKIEGEEIVKMGPFSNIPLWQKEDLEKDPSVVKGSIKILKEGKDVIRYRDIKKAIREAESADEVRSMWALQEKKNDEKFKLLSKQLNIVRGQLRKKDLEADSNLADSLEQIHQEKGLNKVDLIKKVVGNLASGTDIKKAIKDAELEFRKEEYYKDNGELLNQIAQFSAVVQQQSELIAFLKSQVGNGNHDPRRHIIQLEDDVKKG